jgi:hypothetical protein
VKAEHDIDTIPDSLALCLSHQLCDSRVPRSVDESVKIPFLIVLFCITLLNVLKVAKNFQSLGSPFLLLRHRSFAFAFGFSFPLQFDSVLEHRATPLTRKKLFSSEESSK